MALFLTVSSHDMSSCVDSNKVRTMKGRMKSAVVASTGLPRASCRILLRLCMRSMCAPRMAMT